VVVDEQFKTFQQIFVTVGTSIAIGAPGRRKASLRGIQNNDGSFASLN
jgi:hypothetical protein